MLPLRQVHLDFHTSPFIPGVGADFNPGEFVQTLQAAHVNSITVFAKCHHGYSYYPTRVGTPHPYLQRDLLGEMISTCHAAGIRTPVYLTAVWDELSWATHPEWRQITPDGCIAGVSQSPFVAGWKNLCMNTTYADYVIAQTEEILNLYAGDGFFIDIAKQIGGPCVCSTCLAQMQAEGIDPQDSQQLWQFSLATERRFLERLTMAIQDHKPESGTIVPQSIFYNARLVMTGDPRDGVRPELDNYTHLEIETLPGGSWGYDHFPWYVRFFQTFDRQLIAMTGRFHTTWGDFGGLRNRAALEFECFQALAHGAGVSIGDQLHPRGQLHPTVYQRIGEVYSEIERREPWCVDTRPLLEIGVVTTGTLNGPLIPVSDQGALHILEQLKYQFQVLDTGCDLSSYAVIILPDAIPVDAAFAAQLRQYLTMGGKLLITGSSSLDRQMGNFVLADQIGADYVGPAPFAPDYLLLGTELADDIEPMEYICEKPGLEIQVRPGIQVLAFSGETYFNRTWEHFCSHQYTPMEKATSKPVIVQNGNVIYIARPFFAEYADSARRVHKQVIANCLQRLLPRPRIGKNNLPSTAIVTVRQRANGNLVVHVLHYVHQRRGKTLDIIEDILPLHDARLCLRTDVQAKAVRLAPENLPLSWEWQEGYISFTIPEVNGYQIVEISLV